MTCWRTRRQIGAELDEHLRGDALALADEAEQDVLGADVVVAELQRLAQRQLEHLLRSRRERDVPGRRRAALADDLFDLVADGLERDAQALERLGGDAFTFVDETEQDVLGADVAVAQQPSFFLGQHHDPPGPIGEAFKHDGSVSAWRVAQHAAPRALGPTAHCATFGGIRDAWLAWRRGRPRRSSHSPA